MTAFELVRDLDRRGVLLRAVDGQLHVKARVGVISAGERTALTAQKHEILKLLASRAERQGAGTSAPTGVAIAEGAAGRDAYRKSISAPVNGAVISKIIDEALAPAIEELDEATWEQLWGDPDRWQRFQESEAAVNVAAIGGDQFRLKEALRAYTEVLGEALAASLAEVGLLTTCLHIRDPSLVRFYADHPRLRCARCALDEQKNGRHISEYSWHNKGELARSLGRAGICDTCGGQQWWLSDSGVLTCDHCHRPVDESRVECRMNRNQALGWALSSTNTSSQFPSTENGVKGHNR